MQRLPEVEISVTSGWRENGTAVCIINLYPLSVDSFSEKMFAQSSSPLYLLHLQSWTDNRARHVCRWAEVVRTEEVAEKNECDKKNRFVTEHLLDLYYTALSFVRYAAQYALMSDNL